MRLELLSNATVVDDAIRFVSQKSKDKDNLKSCGNSSRHDDQEESNEPDYDGEDKDQLEDLTTYNMTTYSWLTASSLKSGKCVYILSSSFQ